MQSKVHFKGLNGIRAIAAFSVVFSHIGLAGKDYGLFNTTSIDLAGFGVSIFFALSGFLITYLLLTERSEFSEIQIGQFYVRRILRIWPLYFFYLGLVILTLYIYEKDQINNNIIFYFILTANIPFILNKPILMLAHYWSLGVEEQFYVFWPWIVKKSKSLLKFCIGFTAALIFLKLVFRFLSARTGFVLPYLILQTTRFHCMSIGAIGAIYYFEGNKLFLKFMMASISQLVAWLSVVLMAINEFHIASVVDNEIVSILAVVLIVNVATNERSIIKLDYPVFDFFGRISFGIYVYHPLIIFLFGHLFSNWISGLQVPYRYTIIFSCIPAITILCAAISYYLFEKRFIDAKRKYSKVISVA